jgi:hypothetical protein
MLLLAVLLLAVLMLAVLMLAGAILLLLLTVIWRLALSVRALSHCFVLPGQMGPLMALLACHTFHRERMASQQPLLPHYYPGLPY